MPSDRLGDGDAIRLEHALAQRDESDLALAGLLRQWGGVMQSGFSTPTQQQAIWTAQACLAAHGKEVP